MTCGLQDVGHELVPADGALVGDVMNTRHLGHTQLDELGGQVAGEGGVPHLVVDKGHLVALGGHPQHRLDHVVAVSAAHPRGARNRPRRIDLPFATELGATVYRARCRGVPLDIGARLGAVEHVVGRDVHHVRSDSTGPIRDEAGGERVDVVGDLGLHLALVHGGEGRTVQDQIRAPLGDDTESLIAVGDVTGVDVDAQHLVVGVLQGCQGLGAELAR